MALPTDGRLVQLRRNDEQMDLAEHEAADAEDAA